MQIEALIKAAIDDAVRNVKEELKLELVRELSTFNSPWLTRKEAANYLKVCLATIDNAVRDGRLEKFKCNRSTKFRRSDLDKLAA